MRCHIQLDLIVNRVENPEKAADLAERMIQQLYASIPVTTLGDGIEYTVTEHRHGARIPSAAQLKRRVKGGV